MLPQLLGALCIQCLPYTAYVLLSRGRGWRARVLVGLGYAALLQIALASDVDPLSAFVVPAFGLAYFALAAVPVYAAARAFGDTPPSRAVLLCAIGVVFIVLPTLLFPVPGAGNLAILGSEIALAAYSYCMEATRGGRATSLRECLFFLIVNPVLVFAERGTPIESPTARKRGALRSFLGIASLALHHFLLVAGTRFGPIAYAPIAALRDPRGYARFMGHHLVRLIAGYAGHSGRASLDVGLMTLLGRDIPERYRYPLLAKDPLEFWRRWNTYVGSWARRYVFTPSSLALQRRLRGAPVPLLKALAIVLTFLAIGAWHDLVVVVRTGEANWGGMLVFALHAALLITWLAARQLAQRIRTPRATGVMEAPRSEPRVPLAPAFAWLCFAHLMALTAWIAVPGMSGTGLGPPLQQLAALFSRTG